MDCLARVVCVCWCLPGSVPELRLGGGSIRRQQKAQSAPAARGLFRPFRHQGGAEARLHLRFGCIRVPRMGISVMPVQQPRRDHRELTPAWARET